MKNRIMKLEVVDDLPVVLGEVYVTPETDGHYTVCESRVSESAVHKGTHRVVAHLLAMELGATSGLFAVFAEDKEFTTIDPDNTGKVMTQYKLDAEKIKEWPVWRGEGTQPDSEDPKKTIPWSGIVRPTLPVGPLPWTIGDIIVTQARPSILSSIGSVNLINNLDTATTAAIGP